MTQEMEEDERAQIENEEAVSVDHGDLDVESTQHFSSADVVVEGFQSAEYIHQRGDWIVATHSGGGCTLYDADTVSLDAVTKYYEQYPDWQITHGANRVDLGKYEQAMEADTTQGSDNGT